jgi:hypothetical protein
MEALEHDPEDPCLPDFSDDGEISSTSIDTASQTYLELEMRRISAAGQGLRSWPHPSKFGPIPDANRR